MEQPAAPIPDSGAAPQRTSRGRIAAAVALLSLAVAGMSLNFVAIQHGDDPMLKHAQARTDMFQAEVILRLTYYLRGAQGQDSPAPKATRDFAETGAQSAAAYFHKAARRFRNADDLTAAAASAAALYSDAGDDWRAVVALQEAINDGGRGDVLFFLVRLYSNERPTPEWLASDEFKWITRQVPAHLLIASHINRKLGRAERVEQLQQAMSDAGAITAARVGAFVAVGGVLCLWGLTILVRGIFRSTGFGPYAGLPKRPWGLWEGLELMGAWLVLSLILGQFAGVGTFWGAAGLVAGILASYVLASVIALAWFARSVAPRGTGLRTAGWRAANVRRSMLDGAAAYAAALPIVAATVLLAMRLLPEPPANPLVAAMIEAEGWVTRSLVLILACAAAPVAEETVFRGGLYGGMRKRWSPAAAALVSSAIFAAVHMNWASFLPVMALGVALCVIYERTGSLVPSMVGHGLFNLVNAVAIFSLS